MRHRKKTQKLGRNKAHRTATLRNMARALFEHHQIKTTLTRAKAARGFIERLITFGKKGTVAARREVFKSLQNHKLVQVLFEEIAPTYADRNGGYTRVIKLGRRKGDGAEVAVLQLVGFEPLIIDEKKQAPKKARKKAAPKKETAPAEEKTEKEAAAEEPVEKKEAPKKKTAKKEDKAAKPEKKKAPQKAKPAAKKKESKPAEKKEKAKAPAKKKSDEAKPAE